MTISERIVHYIQEFTAENGYPPTIREIAVEVQRGTTAVKRWLDILETAGRITRKRGSPRTVRLVGG